MSRRAARFAAIGCGLGIWLVVLASVDTPLEGSVIWLFPMAAFVLGAATQSSAFLIGAALVALPLALAGFTSPRGDHDGLWLLIFLILLIVGLLSAAAAAVGRWLAQRRTH